MAEVLKRLSFICSLVREWPQDSLKVIPMTFFKKNKDFVIFNGCLRLCHYIYNSSYKQKENSQAKSFKDFLMQCVQSNQLDELKIDTEEILKVFRTLTYCDISVGT